ncbi:homeobox protein NANOG [Amia ocellicauda]|uniref:homeobox protein NANOG n=1 Tax=Amia ocellicauda TaxID=2972642 RepID=UPI003463AD96
MADWRLPVNYNPSYHAYAYGLMYQPPPEQNHPSFGWGDAGYGPSGAGGLYLGSPPVHHPQYAAAAPPGQGADSGPGGEVRPTAVLYFGGAGSQQDPRVFAPHNRIGRPESSETSSDAEPLTPDSWSSGSSSHPLAVVPTRAQPKGSPGGQLVTSLQPGGKGKENRAGGGEEEDGEEEDDEEEETDGVTDGPTPSPPADRPPRKAKSRTAFSEGQMCALTQRFSMQRYLTPVEMKNLAGLTGLTYKQVKTWFQNRRMKLKRHQKDSSWVAERYPNSPYPSVGAHTPFQGDSAMMQDCYPSSQFRDPGFPKKSPPSTPSYYPAPGTPACSPATPRGQEGGWPPAGHYDYCTPNSHINTYTPNNSSNNYTSLDPVTQSQCHGVIDTSPVAAPLHTSPQW